jgi:NADPH-dependent 2,4-dienoyl-CoA reductase/sulfur reductase-like enzyme
VQRVRLKSGAVLDADLVVAGLGVTPATDLLQGVRRREDGGLEVDAQLRVADGLYAAGDIAAFPLRGDGERVRVEHWRVAEQHGRVAALNMLGHATAYDAVPYFWTIHYLKRLDYVGHAAAWDDVVIDGDLETPEFTAFYVRNGTVAAVAGWGRDRQMAHAIALITDRRDWTAAELRRALG